MLGSGRLGYSLAVSLLLHAVILTVPAPGLSSRAPLSLSVVLRAPPAAPLPRVRSFAPPAPTDPSPVAALPLAEVATTEHHAPPPEVVRETPPPPPMQYGDPWRRRPAWGGVPPDAAAAALAEAERRQRAAQLQAQYVANLWMEMRYRLGTAASVPAAGRCLLRRAAAFRPECDGEGIRALAQRLDLAQWAATLGVVEPSLAGLALTSDGGALDLQPVAAAAVEVVPDAAPY